MRAIALATEDELSEAIGLRLIAESPFHEADVLPLRRNGSGYLKSKVESWRQLAGQQVVLLLTDLDQIDCPVALRNEWLGTRPVPDRLLLRIAVREIESWVLADHDAMRKLIGDRGKLPPAPDELGDPKAFLLNMVRKYAPRDVKQDLLAERGAMASQGLGYNRRLVAWVKSDWSPDRAAARSPSLLRARQALRDA
ncbi:hypothetical protein V8H18_00005 [Lautropia mirabilis]|jgi:hypothetical protein